jgi:hypothetical protein
MQQSMLEDFSLFALNAAYDAQHFAMMYDLFTL